MTLLEDALNASGGMDRWHQLKRFTVHMSIDGALLARKGKAGLLKDVVAEGCTHTVASVHRIYRSGQMRRISS